MTSAPWALRPATADDRGFVAEVNRAAMGPYLEATFGWDDAAQRAYFAEQFDASGGRIIQVDGVDVGELLVDERHDELELVRIAIVPAWQGRGLGSAVVAMLIDRARELERPVVLRVFKSNPRAARLYESLGFVRTAESDADVTMRFDPRV